MRLRIKWNREKTKALCILLGIGVGVLCCVLAFSVLIFLLYPLLIALICLLVGMIVKWVVEWFIKNIRRFRLGDKAKKVKEKLRVDKAVTVVKDSVEIIRKDTDDSEEP